MRDAESTKGAKQPTRVWETRKERGFLSEMSYSKIQRVWLGRIY
jgi:hypothetical protein